MTYINPSHIHYRTSFHLVNVDGTENSWGELVTEIRKWCHGKTTINEKVYGDWFYRGGKKEYVDSNIMITVATCTGNDTPWRPQYWAVKMNEPCKEYPRIRQWITDIGVTSIDESRYEFSLTTSYSIRPGYMGDSPIPPLPTTPYIVRNLLCSSGWEGYSGKEKLSCVPLELKVGGVPNFINSLKSEDRKCPIVYLSKEYITGKALLDANHLAKVLSGNAIVYVAKSSELDKETEYLLPQNFRCWDGRVRVYQPRVNLGDPESSRYHRYFIKDEIRNLTPEVVTERLVEGLVRHSRLLTRPTIASLQDIYSVRMYEHVARLKESKSNELTPELLEELDSMMEQGKQLKSEISNLEERSLELEILLEEKEKDASSHKYAYDKLIVANNKYRKENDEIKKKADLLREFDELPSSLVEVIEKLESLHAGKVVFLEEAKKSAKAYQIDVNIAWKCLWALSTTLHYLLFYESRKGDIEKEFKEVSGIDFTMTEGGETKKRKRLMKQRQVKYKGNIIDITPHIKYGNKPPKLLRVHFYIANDEKKIIVGHCGDHLDTYSTQFRK